MAANSPSTAESPPAPEARLPIALTAGLVFLLPLMSAIGGAYLAERFIQPKSILSGVSPLGGWIVGLVVGIALAKLLLVGLCRRNRHGGLNNE